MNKKILKIIILTGVLISLYAGSTAIWVSIKNEFGTVYDRSIEGDTVEHEDVDLTSLDFDWDEYAEILANSSLFDDLASEYLDQLSEDTLTDIMESLSGNGDFDPSMFDELADLDPEVLGAVLLLPQFYAYDPSGGVISDVDDMLIRTTSYDEYTADFSWARSFLMDDAGKFDPYSLETSTLNEYLTVEYPTVKDDYVNHFLPSLGIDARIQSVDSIPDEVIQSFEKHEDHNGVYYGGQFDPLHRRRPLHILVSLHVFSPPLTFKRPSRTH